MLKLLENSIPVVTLLALTVPIATQAAVARKSAAKQPAAQEVYSATESEDDIPSATRVASPVAVTQQQPSRPSRQQANVPALKAPAKLPDSALAYDPVPTDQVDALSKRLQLVDALIRRHGRAYDYRTHTVRDLELILLKLDATDGASVTTARAE